MNVSKKIIPNDSSQLKTDKFTEIQWDLINSVHPENIKKSIAFWLFQGE